MATHWVATSVGVAVGAGFYIIAIVATALASLALLLVKVARAHAIRPLISSS